MVKAKTDAPIVKATLMLPYRLVNKNEFSNSQGQLRSGHEQMRQRLKLHVVRTSFEHGNDHRHDAQREWLHCLSGKSNNDSSNQVLHQTKTKR